MENESNEIYAAFGLEAPAAESAESTAPDEATGDPGTGPEAQNPAEDAEASDNAPQAESTEAEQPQENPGSESAESAEPEEDVETAKPVQANKYDEDAAYAASFMGRKNPYTGQPIKTKADYEQYIRDKEAADRRAQEEAANEEIRKIGISPEQLEALMKQTSFGKAMQSAMDYTRQQAEDSRRKAVDDLIRKDIEDIAQYDPRVKDIDSLKKTAHGKEIERRVKTGRVTWKEAWILENFDAMKTAQTEAAKQAAMNTAASKNHLQSTAQRGSGETDVPRDVMEMYEVMGFKDKDEIRKSYSDYIKSTQKG